MIGSGFIGRVLLFWLWLDAAVRLDGIGSGDGLAGWGDSLCMFLVELFGLIYSIRESSQWNTPCNSR
jgi:hypothetical protein